MPNLIKPIEFTLNGVKTLVKELPEGFKHENGKFFIPNFPDREVSKDMFEMVLEKVWKPQVKSNIQTGISSKIRKIKSEVKGKIKTYNPKLDKAIAEEAIENGTKVILGEKNIPILRSFNPYDNAQEIVPDVFTYLVMGENGVKHFGNDITLVFRGNKANRGINLEFDPSLYGGNFASSLGVASYGEYNQAMPHVYTLRRNPRFPTIEELESTKQGLKEVLSNNFDVKQGGIKLYAIPTSQIEAMPRFSAHGGSYQHFGEPIIVNGRIYNHIDPMAHKYQDSGFIVDDVFDGAYNVIKKGTVLDRDFYLNEKHFKNNPRLLKQAEPVGLLDRDGIPIYKLRKGTVLSQNTYVLPSDIVLPRQSKNTVGFQSVGGNYGTFGKNLSVIKRKGGKLIKKKKWQV